MDRFPRMLYRAPGPTLLHGVMVEYAIAGDEAESAEAEAEGWCLSPAAAQAALEAESQADAGAEAPSDNSGPPTRAELEQKARALGVGFNSRTTDATILYRIDEKLRSAP